MAPPDSGLSGQASLEVHSTGKGLSCNLKLVEASLAQVAGGNGECKANQDQEGSQGTLGQRHPMSPAPAAEPGNSQWFHLRSTCLDSSAWQPRPSPSNIAGVIIIP